MPKSGEVKICASRAEIADTFKAKIRRMSEALFASADLLLIEPAPTGIRLADSTKCLGMKKSIDFVLTSPPYCTRIDYTAATRIQLAVLSPMLQFQVSDLSRSMIGSTKVPKNVLEIRPEWSQKCVDFLDKVGKHGSRASENYYLKTHVDYFVKIDRSLENVAKALKPYAAAIIVVQDSYYKEIHNDVPSFISDIAGRHGLELKRRDDFIVRNSMSGINPRARAYNKHSSIVESVLCFQKS